MSEALEFLMAVLAQWHLRSGSCAPFTGRRQQHGQNNVVMTSRRAVMAGPVQGWTRARLNLRKAGPAQANMCL
jgi:hypothetical protein